MFIRVSNDSSIDRSGGFFQVLDHPRLDLGVADEGQHIARRSARRVVIDRYVSHVAAGLQVTVLS